MPTAKEIADQVEYGDSLLGKQKPTIAELADDAYMAERRELFGSIDRLIVKAYGERCSEVNGGCLTCATWAARDALNAALIEY